MCTKSITRSLRATLCSLTIGLSGGLSADGSNSIEWSHLRGLGPESLHALSERVDAAESNAALGARALLTLADQSINRSASDAMEFLERAEMLIRPNSEERLVATAIRCQLEHRQSLPGAVSTCEALDGEVTEAGQFVQAFVHVTRMYYFYREGVHERSIEEAERALSLAALVDDPALMAAAHNMIGLHFSTRLRPRMSLPHFEAALEQAARLPYDEAKIITQLNLASSYTYLGRGREALGLLSEPRNSQLVRLYPTRWLVVQSMIGQAKAAVGDTSGAEEELQRVLSEVGEVVLPDGMTFGHTGLGVIRLAEGRSKEALESFDRVLEITGKGFESDLGYPRIQLIAVPYAVALRESGQLAAAQDLLTKIIASVPADEPDQHLLDAYRELSVTLGMLGDSVGAMTAAESAARVESELWDASFQYQVARLSSALQADRRQLELERAQERELALLDLANRESRLRRQSWIIGALLLALVALLFSRRAQKRIANVQRSASLALENQVRERTQELEDEMARRMAAEVDRLNLAERVVEGEKLRAMGQLTAGVAHDFNNLMTVVTLGVNQLKGALAVPENPAAVETLENIRSAADTGAKITRGLLAYVREQPLKPEVLQLDTFLIESASIFRNTIGERVTLELDTEPSSVLADKGQLTTAMLNLLLNAKEAMSGGGLVAILLRNSGDYAQIEVRDQGSGMSSEVLEQATEPFFTTKQHEEGSGLGLSMVYGFARQSNGDLRIESEPSRGTTVTLTLPVASAKSATVVELPSAAPKIPRNTSILAVEDRGSLLRVLEQSLNRIVDTVICASSADDALALVEERGMPDCVVTDIVMPGELDGMGLVRKLREVQPSLPAVLMSGYARDIESDSVHLQKPFSFEQLESAIEAALARKVDVEAAVWPKASVTD